MYGTFELNTDCRRVRERSTLHTRTHVRSTNKKDTICTCTAVGVLSNHPPHYSFIHEGDCGRVYAIHSAETCTNFYHFCDDLTIKAPYIFAPFFRYRTSALPFALCRRPSLQRAYPLPSNIAKTSVACAFCLRATKPTVGRLNVGGSGISQARKKCALKNQNVWSLLAKKSA